LQDVGAAERGTSLVSQWGGAARARDKLRLAIQQAAACLRSANFGRMHSRTKEQRVHETER